jgi:tetratricopeptide (TPR) repeat protein
MVEEPNLERRLLLSEEFLLSYPDSELRHLVIRTRWEAFRLNGDDSSLIEEATLGSEAEIDYFEAKTQAIVNPGVLPQFRAFEIAHFDALTGYYQSLMEAYARRMDWIEAEEFGELAYDAEDRTWESYGREVDEDSDEYQSTAQSHRGVQVSMLQTMMAISQSADDASGTIDYADRILVLDPENLPTLMTAAQVMAEQPADSDEGLVANMERAEAYASSAVANLENLLSNARPDQVAEPEAARLRFTVHSTLGLVHSRQLDYEGAEREYLLALDAVPGDATTYFRLGLTYANTNKADDAMSALARAASIDPAFSAARQTLEQVYVQVNGSLEGVDEFIELEGQRLRTQ